MSTTFDYDEAIESLDQRIAVLRRYRRLLELQRDRLNQYLSIIDAREEAVRLGDVLRLEEYTAQEQAVVRGVLTVQKCLEPLRPIYAELHPEGAPEIADLEQRLERIRVEILRRNAESRAILRNHADQLKVELGGLRAKTQPVSVFASDEGGRLIDLQG